MAIERTFSIIKPDATRRNLTGQINARLEAAGLRIVGQKRKQLTEAEAKAFESHGPEYTPESHAPHSSDQDLRFVSHRWRFFFFVHTRGPLLLCSSGQPRQSKAGPNR